MWKNLALVCGFIGFIIGSTKLLMIWFDLIIAISMSVMLFGLILLIVLIFDAFIIVRVHKHRPLHARLLESFRRWVVFSFEAVILELWHSHVTINSRGNATVVTELVGKVQFGANRWITCVIHTSIAQPLINSGFKIRITNIITGKRVVPELIIDEPTYKMFKINFEDIMRSGKFHYKYEYKLKGSFHLDKPDFWYHIARRQEEKVIISVDLPRGYNFKDTYSGETITEFGDDTWGKDPNSQPRLVNPQRLQWEITRVMRGTKHKLCWEPEKA